MKKFLYTLLLFSPSAVLATGEANSTFPNEVPQKEIGELIGMGINAILGIAGVIAVWFLVIGGFQYITSAGNPESVSKAKNTVFYAIIGLIVVILSFAIINFVINAF